MRINECWFFLNCDQLYSAFYNLKMKYDESDNIAVRASRAVTDRIGDTFGIVIQSSLVATMQCVCVCVHRWNGFTI